MLKFFREESEKKKKERKNWRVPIAICIFLFWQREWHCLYRFPCLPFVRTTSENLSFSTCVFPQGCNASWAERLSMAICGYLFVWDFVALFERTKKPQNRELEKCSKRTKEEYKKKNFLTDLFIYSLHLFKSTGGRDRWTHLAPSSSLDPAAGLWRIPPWSCKLILNTNYMNKAVGYLLHFNVWNVNEQNGECGGKENSEIFKTSGAAFTFPWIIERNVIELTYTVKGRGGEEADWVRVITKTVRGKRSVFV